MLMDILMEALMSMDDESLDSVLESCSEEELEIIDSAMEESLARRAKKLYIAGGNDLHNQKPNYSNINDDLSRGVYNAGQLNYIHGRNAHKTEKDPNTGGLQRIKDTAQSVKAGVVFGRAERREEDARKAGNTERAEKYKKLQKSIRDKYDGAVKNYAFNTGEGYGYFNNRK